MRGINSRYIKYQPDAGFRSYFPFWMSGVWFQLYFSFLYICMSWREEFSSFFLFFTATGTTSKLCNPLDKRWLCSELELIHCKFCPSTCECIKSEQRENLNEPDSKIFCNLANQKHLWMARNRTPFYFSLE